MPTMKKVNCVICNKEFEIELKRYNAKLKENSQFYCSADCRSHKNSELCICATCGKEIWKTKSEIKRSKSGRVYCSRHCATISNNTLYKSGENHPSYKGTDYRQKALQHYDLKCICCGYDEDTRILEVHHIDENHKNNDLSNLCILCPNCHRKITLQLYYLDQNYKLIPKQ